MILKDSSTEFLLCRPAAVSGILKSDTYLRGDSFYVCASPKVRFSAKKKMTDI